MGWKDTITEEKEPKGWKSTIREMEHDEIPSQSALETFVETAVDEATLGYYPQIAAGIKTFGGTTDDYTSQRDYELRELQKGQIESPISSGLGTGAAIIGQMAVPVGGAARLAKLAKSGAPIAKQALIEGVKNFGLGTAISGLKNPGDTSNEVDVLQAEKRLENMTSEAPMNAIAGVAGGFLDFKAAKKAAAAPVNIVKALKPTPTKAAVLIKDDAKRAKEVGQFIFDKKIVKPGDSADSILTKAEIETKKAGQALQNFIKNSSKTLDEIKEISDVKFNPSFDPDRDLPQLYGELQTYLAKSGYSGSNEVTDTVIEQVLADFASLKEISKRSSKISNSDAFSLNLDGLNQMKRFMQDQVASYDKIADSTKDAGAMSEAYNFASKFFSKKVDQEIARFGDDSIGKALKNLNKQYSLASDARGLAQRHAVKEFTKQSSSIPFISGLGTSGVTYGLTKDPMVSGMVGAATGIATGAIQNMAPTTKAALGAMAPDFVSRSLIPKASAYYSAQESTQVFEAEKMMNQALMQGIPPFVIDNEIKKSELTPTEKAKLRNKNAKAVK